MIYSYLDILQSFCTSILGRKEKFGFPFNSLGHIAYEIKIWEEIPFSLKIVPRGLLVAEGP